MSLVTKKPVFGVCDQLRFKPACSATETSQGLEILDIASIDIVLSKQQTTKALIRLCGCAGWSAPLLFAYSKNRFSHDVAHMIPDRSWVSLSRLLCDDIMLICLRGSLRDRGDFGEPGMSPLPLDVWDTVLCLGDIGWSIDDWVWNDFGRTEIGTMCRYRGSYMSAHVSLNLLNKLEKKIRCEALLSI